MVYREEKIDSKKLKYSLSYHKNMIAKLNLKLEEKLDFASSKSLFSYHHF